MFLYKAMLIAYPPKCIIVSWQHVQNFKKKKGLIQWVGDFDFMMCGQVTQTVNVKRHAYPPTCITVSWYYALHMKKNGLIQ